MAKRTFTVGPGAGKGRRRQHGEVKEHGSDGDPAGELSRTNSYDFMAVAAAAASSSSSALPAAASDAAPARDSETLYYHERHLVPVESVRTGMARFSFLLETCSPGSVPDPLLVAALLDLVRLKETEAAPLREAFRSSPKLR